MLETGAKAQPRVTAAGKTLERHPITEDSRGLFPRGPPLAHISKEDDFYVGAFC